MTTNIDHIKTYLTDINVFVISADLTDQEKWDIINQFKRSNDNSVILLSKASAEGVNLTHISAIHILEPYINYSVIL